MIRRLIISVFVTLAGLLLVAVLGLAALLMTGPGRNAVLGFALPRLENATGLKITYEKVGGAWPNRITFEGLAVADDEGICLTADRLLLDWRPIALLGNRVTITLLATEGADFIREPRLRETEPTEPDARTPTPEIVVATLRMKRLHLGAALIDQEMQMDLDGGFALRGGRRLGGSVNADVDTPHDFPESVRELLGAGFKLRGRLSGDVRDGIEISALAVETRNGQLKIGGAFGYGIPGRVIHADVVGTADPGLASWISTDFSTAEPIALKVKVDGRVSELAIKAGARLGKSRYEARAIPPLSASADLVRTHEEVAGPIAVEFLKTGGSAVEGGATADFAYGTEGRIHIDDLSARYNNATLKGGVDLQTEPMDGDISFETDIPELASLPLADVGAEGDLKAKGRVRIAGSRVSIDAEATSTRLGLEGAELRSTAMKAAGPLAALGVEIKLGSLTHPSVGTLREADVAGVVGIEDQTISISLERLIARLAGEEIRLASPTRFAISPQALSLSPFDVSWGPMGRFTGSAERRGDDLKLALKIEGFEPPQLPAVINGTIDVDTRRSVAGRIDLAVVPTLSGRPEVQMKLGGDWNRKRLSLTAAFEGYGEDSTLERIEPLKLSLPLALTTGKGLSISLDGSVEGRLSYKGQIAPFVALAPLPEQTLTGEADIDLRVSGTTSSPVFGGNISLKKGTYEHVGRGVLLDRLSIDGRVRQTARGYVLSADLTASDGTPHAEDAVPIKAKAAVTLGPKAPHIDANASLEQARIVHSERITATAAGTLGVSGTLPNLAAKGDFTLQSLEFAIPDTLSEGVVEIKVVPVDDAGRPIEPEELPADERTPINVTLGVAVTAPERVFIRGRGLESEWAADLNIVGTKDDPRIAGTLTIRRGRFDFSGRRFELTRGVIGFAATRSIDPDLDVEAQYRAPSDTIAYIRVGGRASAPRITLASDPPQAEEDVMSLILFGKPAKELSAFEAVQTANAVAQLTGTGPFSGPSILDRARSTLGLDLLNISLSGGAQGISVGKYIQEGVYVSAKQGLAGQPGSVSVNVDVNKWLSLKTDVGQDSQSSAGIFWKKDY